VFCFVFIDEVFFDHDKPYEVLHINVSDELWKLAMNPTPVLKSPVTIVVPVHVPQDVDDESENEIATEETVVENPVQEQDEVVTNAPTEAAVSENPQNRPPIVPVPVSQQQQEQQQVNGSLIRFPCACRSGQCGCCTGAMLQRYKTKVCGNITFIPEDFIFDVRLSVNNNTVIRRRVSGNLFTY
jgi:hypothetical protein